MVLDVSYIKLIYLSWRWPDKNQNSGSRQIFCSYDLIPINSNIHTGGYPPRYDLLNIMFLLFCIIKWNEINKCILNNVCQPMTTLVDKH